MKTSAHCHLEGSSTEDWLTTKEAAEIFGLNPTTLNGHHHRELLSKVIRKKRVKVGRGTAPMFWNRADCEAVMKIHREQDVSLMDAARIANGESIESREERRRAAKRRYREKKRLEKSIPMRIATWKRPEGIDAFLEQCQ